MLMPLSARQINEKYLNKMLNATEATKVLFRIKEYWWPHFLETFQNDPAGTLDALDRAMDRGQEQLRQVAIDHATGMGFEPGSSEFIQRVSQVTKSSTGKMFERFIALSIAHSLKNYNSDYCVWSFTNDLARITDVFKKEDLEVEVSLQGGSYSTAIDADFVVFNQADPEAEYYLVSIKSTLKDRFHNVPFWNLLRQAAVKSSIENLVPRNREEAARPKYVAICSDLAQEQPDFSADGGPRNMLCLDAALLDGAYVSASRARGLGGRDEQHLGIDRVSPFYPLSLFVRHLCPNMP